jgi:hypothetical protein
VSRLCRSLALPGVGGPSVNVLQVEDVFYMVLSQHGSRWLQVLLSLPAAGNSPCRHPCVRPYLSADDARPEHVDNCSSKGALLDSNPLRLACSLGPQAARWHSLTCAVITCVWQAGCTQARQRQQ